MSNYIMTRMQLPNGTEQNVFYQREVCTNEDGITNPTHILRIGVGKKPKKFTREVILTPKDVSRMYLLMTRNALTQIPDLQHPIYIGVPLDESTPNSIKISKNGAHHIPKKDYKYIINIDKDGQIIEHTLNGKQFESAIKFVKTVVDTFRTEEEIDMNYVTNHCIDYKGEISLESVKKSLK